MTTMGLSTMVTTKSGADAQRPIGGVVFTAGPAGAVPGGGGAFPAGPAGATAGRPRGFDRPRRELYVHVPMEVIDQMVAQRDGVWWRPRGEDLLRRTEYERGHRAPSAHKIDCT